MWIIEHCYDVDGGFGDAVGVRDTIGIVKTKEEADDYIAKWSNREIYDKPYANLYHKKLIAREVKMLDIDKDPFGKGCGMWGGYNYQHEEEGE